MIGTVFVKIVRCSCVRRLWLATEGQLVLRAPPIVDGPQQFDGPLALADERVTGSADGDAVLAAEAVPSAAGCPGTDATDCQHAASTAAATESTLPYRCEVAAPRASPARHCVDARCS